MNDSKRFKSSQFGEYITHAYNNKKTVYTYIQDWKTWMWQAAHNTRITL